MTEPTQEELREIISKPCPSLKDIVDESGCVAGDGNEIYFGEDEIRNADLPMKIIFTNKKENL